MKKAILYTFIFFIAACSQSVSVNELITGKWKGVTDGNPIHFIMLNNKALYFYVSNISEMDLFQEQLKKGTNKPVKWDVIDEKYLSFKIYDYAKNYEIIELTDTKLVIKDMLKNNEEGGEITLYKSKLNSFETRYVNENNYNQGAGLENKKNDTVK